MNLLGRIGAVCAAVLLSACALHPQLPIELAPASLQSARIGIVMTGMPKVDTSLPGASCLLCLAAASVANSSLTDYTHTLGTEDLPPLKEQVADAMRKKGMNVVVIPEDVNIEALPDAPVSAPNSPAKDYSSFGPRYKIDRLMVINVTALGFVRTYSSYIPTSDPKGMFQANAFIVNFSTGSYDWYLPVNVAKSAAGNWDEPPTFPGLTNAYFQALETGKDSILKPFM